MPESKDFRNMDNITDVEFTEEKKAPSKEEEAEKDAAKKKAPLKEEEAEKDAAKKKAPLKEEEAEKDAAKKTAPLKEEEAEKKAPAKEKVAEKDEPKKEGGEKEDAPKKEAPQKDGKEEKGITGSFNFIEEEPQLVPTKNKSSDLMEQVQITALKNRYMEMEAQADNGRYSPFSVMEYDSIKASNDKKNPYVVVEMHESGAKIYNRPDRIDLHYKSTYEEGSNGKRTQAASQLSFEDCMAMVRLGMEKGWTATTLSGPPEFQAQMYLACRALGMEVKGYQPTEELMKQGDAKWAENAVARDHAQSMDQRFPRLEDERQAANLGYDGINQEFVKDLKAKGLGYEAPAKDGQKKEEPAKDGQKKEEPAKDGQKKEEPAKDGQKKEKPAKDGQKKEEPAKDGQKKEEPAKDGQKKEEPAKDGQKKEKPAKDGQKKEKPAKDGQKKEEPTKVIPVTENNGAKKEVTGDTKKKVDSLTKEAVAALEKTDPAKAKEAKKKINGEKSPSKALKEIGKTANEAKGNDVRNAQKKQKEKSNTNTAVIAKQKGKGRG